MGEVLIGTIGLIILVFFMIRQKNREEKHQHLLKHSAKYRSKVGVTFYRAQGTTDEKERLTALKEIKKDPREVALIKDSVTEEYINDAIKLQKIIHRNEVAYKYRSLIQEMVPNRQMPFTVSNSQIQKIASRNYPNLIYQDIISELVEAEVVGHSFTDFDTKQLSYSLRVDRIYHPKERDQKGRRILIHNLTVFEYPNETF